MFRGRRALALAAVSALAAAGQGEATVGDDIAALIERTNALERFRIVYLMEVEEEGEEPEEVTLEFAYEAPDSACFRASGAKELEIYILGQRTYQRAEGEGPWLTFELEDFESRRLLEEVFPRDVPLEAGVSFSLDPREGFGLSMQCSLEGRSALLLWLRIMDRDQEHVVLDGDDLVWTGEGFRLAVSRASGFPREIESESEHKRIHGTLAEVEVDGEVAGTIELPEEARSAELDDARQQQLRAQLRGQLRSSAFWRVEHLLEAEVDEWDARTRAKWEEFLEALHRDMLDLRFSRWLEELRGIVDRIAADVRERLGQGDSPEKRAGIAEHLEEFEHDLVAKLEQSLEKYLGELPPVRRGEDEPREELFAVEREVVEQLHEELLSRAVLDYLHAELDAALGGER